MLGGGITPTYSEKLEESKKYARNCKAQMAGLDLYQVQSGGNIYDVDLAKLTCGCRRWDMTAIPCHHVVSAIYKSKQHPEDFVSAFFKKEMYMAAYNPVIFPVPGPDLWTKTTSRDIDPPVFKKKGRKQTKRRKGQFEVLKPKDTSRVGTISCSNCSKEGHRYTNYGDALKLALVMGKNKHQPNRSNLSSGSTGATKQPAAPKPPRTATASVKTPAPRAAAKTPAPKAAAKTRTPKAAARAATKTPTPRAAAKTTTSTPNTRVAARAPYSAPRAAASHAQDGPSHGQKRKRKPTRWDDYFTASGNH